MPIRPLLTPDDVQAILKVSRRTIQRMVSEGWLTPLRIRGSIRFREEDVGQIIKHFGDDPIAMNCQCVGGPCTCGEPNDRSRLV